MLKDQFVPVRRLVCVSWLIENKIHSLYEIEPHV